MDETKKAAPAKEQSTPAPESTSGSTVRPKPKRKFTFRVGQLDFEARCTVKEAVETFETGGLTALYVLIDGTRFEYTEE
jgi:hypothetical protein